MAETQPKSGQVSNIPAPPRLIGDDRADIVAISSWMNEVFKLLALSGLYVQTAGQFDTGDFDPATLPDPASSTIAKAQTTANEAYTLAAGALAAAQSRALWAGQVTISDAATSAGVTFPEAQDDTSFYVAATPVASTGTPAANSDLVASVAKTTAGFTLNVKAAPGAGNSVTFDLQVQRI